MFKVTFQEVWRTDFSWVKEGPQKGLAACILCKKDNISYGSMGRSALVSHAKSKKHKEQEANANKSLPLKSFFSQIPTSTSCPTTSIVKVSSDSIPTCSSSYPASETSQLVQLSVAETSGTEKLKWWKVKDSVTTAEALWCLKSVVFHNSLRDVECCSKLFSKMFPDSSIAGEIKLSKTKASYSIVYGLAPYFKNKLINDIKKCDFFVVGFDETLNKFAQKQQLDIIVRFWDTNKDQVSSRYLTSAFLSSSTATDLFNALKESLGSLGVKKIIQLSMDGPNVNFKLLQLLKKELEEEIGGHQLLELGSCGLHVVNNAFKAGIKTTKWNVVGFLKSIYYLFKDSPKRRGIYISVSGTSDFPKKVCYVRWLENSVVAKRALDIIDNLKKFVDHVSARKSLKLIQRSACFEAVKSALQNKLLRAKLAFFMSLAEELEPFLREFQADVPMSPFLHRQLYNILKSLMMRFVKHDILSSKPLEDININNDENLKLAKDIDIGYATRAALRKCVGVKDIDVLVFRRDCRDCLKSCVEKLLEKSPLKYPLTDALAFLDPHNVGYSQNEAVQKMATAMDILVTANLIPPSVAQSADREFKEIVCLESVKIDMMSYCKKDTRLDNFWMTLLNNHESKSLQIVIRLLLPLSHGNAYLERGFSVNGEIVIENLKEDSIVAQRIVFDGIAEAGGIYNCQINKDMLLSMRNANNYWKQALDNQRSRQSAEENRKANKRKAALMAKELEEKKKRLILESQKAVADLEEQIKTLKKD